MNTNLDYAERREQDRFLAADRALALISPESPEHPFHIIDISKKGLSFRYLGEKTDQSRIAEVSIFYQDTLYLDKIPVIPVADQKIGEDLMPIRKHGVQFANLTPHQENQLDFYIQQFTSGSV